MIISFRNGAFIEELERADRLHVYVRLSDSVLFIA